MCTTFRSVTGIAMVLMLTVPAAAAQPTPVGLIKVASGSVFVVRDNQSIAAQVGQPLFEADTLRTGGNGSIGVTLKDDTRVSLGPNSELVLKRVIYAPADGGLGLILQVVRGVTAYVSGQIAKLAPDAVRLETPAAIVGVRGTTLAIRTDP